MRRFLTVLSVLLGVFASTRATAQEIQLTGPLAGAPAVRQLRLQRQGRVEIAPSISFTLLDEYQRTILPGGRITYNLADWLAIGVWGAFGAIKSPTGLTGHIQDVTQFRRANEANEYPDNITPNNLLTRASISDSFKDQLGRMDFVVSISTTPINRTPIRPAREVHESALMQRNQPLLLPEPELLPESSMPISSS